MKIYADVAQLIGKTPLVDVTEFVATRGGVARVAVKLESMNPAGSVKDRVALSMLLDAQESGKLPPGGTIIEPTSGNTGIGLAALAAAWGYNAIFTMPDTMSVERRRLLAAYGAQIQLTPGKEGMAGAIRRANELAASIPGSVIPGQFVNQANPAAHYATTGPEIWRDTEGGVAAFVAGVGTGGTLSGVGRYLKEQNPKVRVIAVEPEDSPVLSGGKAGAHALQGIGAGFVPDTFDAEVCDEVIRVRTEDACATGRELARTRGILAGISSGAALWAAAQAAARPEFADRWVVALLPDTGERYLTTQMFAEE